MRSREAGKKRKEVYVNQNSQRSAERRDFIQVKQFANLGNTAPVEIESALHLDKGRLPFIEKLPAQVPNWPSFMQIRFYTNKVFLTALIGLNHAVLIGWYYACFFIWY